MLQFNACWPVAGGGVAGLATRAQLASKTGREILEAMVSGALPYPPINDTMNTILIEVGQGRVVFQGTPESRHYNSLGTVTHGGRQMATAEARIEDENGKLYAHATTTCFVFEVPAAG